MQSFGRTEDVPALLDAVEVVEAVITGELNAQEAAATRIAPENKGCIDDSEKEMARHREASTATRAEQEQRVAAVREAGRARLEEVREKLKGVQHEVAVVHSLTLLLPYELMAEILDWHMLVGGTLAATLLVCKRWTMVAYSSPRLCVSIAVTNLLYDPRLHQVSVLCTDFDHLRLVLSRSQSCPLQVELSFQSLVSSERTNYSSSASLTCGPQAAANRIAAVKLMLGNQILRRCTSIILAKQFLSFPFQNATILPLLSSIRVRSAGMHDRELQFLQSLVSLSPALRHFRCARGLSPESWGVALWTRTIQSYGWLSRSTPCFPLHESPSLRRLGVLRGLTVPLTLPALQVLRWSIRIYSELHCITAPHLHTLILHHSPLFGPELAGSISFPNLRVAIHTRIRNPTALHMFHTPALEHLSIEYRSFAKSPTALLELFDGWTHMPRPKSLHLDCTFTDAALIGVLGRLPWLEELQIGGTGLRETFWEGLTPSYNSIQQASLPNTYTDQHATHILVPKLKALLENYPTDMRRITRKSYPQIRTFMQRMTNHHHPLVDVSMGEGWTVKQASIVAVAREQAGYPLRTLACWSPEQ